ncbi:MAG: acyltransferase [Acetobacteraceae bacterium]|nr:acyltransferase [Acetobacteraceae bacterium]
MTSAQENRALTGLRGFAALLVCAHHLVLNLGGWPPPSETPLRALALRGYLMVDLFFVLSGFVMALAYEDWFAGKFDVETYARFLWRRFARLWPLHAFLVAILLAVQVLDGHILAWWRMVVANLAMVQAWGLSETLNIPSWSLSTEWAAYMLFPALAWLALRGPPTRTIGAAGLAMTALLLAASLGAANPLGRRGPLDLYDNYSLLPLARCLAGFTLGLVARRAMRLRWLARWLAHPGWAAAAAALLLAGLAFGLADWLAYPLLVLLVAALWAGNAGLSRALAHPVPHKVGAWSYALYLVHVPLIHFWIVAGRPGPVLPAGAALLAASVAAAAVLHRIVEVPARRALRGLGRGKAKVAAG